MCVAPSGALTYGECMQPNELQTDSRILLAAALAGLFAACSGDGRDPTDDTPAPDAGADAAPPTPGFSADTRPEGRALWVEADLQGTDAVVAVRGRQLGGAFGLSVHLAWDGEALALDETEPPSTRADVLDPDTDGNAVTIARPGAADLALGGTRASPEAGEVTVDDDFTLAEVRLRTLRGGSSRLELARAVVARADGSLEPVPVAGGTLVVAEVTP